MSKVFICYSHKDEKYLDLLLKHFDDDLLDVWSDKKIEGSEHWEEEIQKALNSANCGILILSANFFNSRFIKDIELEQLLKNQYEKNTYLVPVLAEHCNIDKYTWISKKEVLPKGFKAIENIKPRNHNKEAVKIVKRIEKLLEPIPNNSNTKDIVISHNYPDAIAVNNFPTSNDKFFGREKYFDILDKAWDDEQVNIISFIAFGGIGKTSLIDNWLKRMKENQYKGAKNIFMWSFYSQGNEEDRQVTATEFLLKACKFLKIKKIPKSTYEQGRELADIISKQRVLLVLDGLEPLQSSLEDIGDIKDNGLQVLLQGLSKQNKGLVVITSRIKLSSIDNKYIPLDVLEDKEGAELLKSFELNGSQEELEKISNDFDGHALALKLLGSYLSVVLDKDINRIDEIENLTDDKSKSSKHATRMLNSYKKYLQREGKVELDILKLLGFFDRAISFDVIDILKNKPLMKNINDKLIDVNVIDWKFALENLKKLHLVGNNDNVLDTHPLVREYFSKYIEETYTDSYIKGHYRLYKYYENVPKKEYPDTIEEMEPLFQSIYHGCKANEIDKSYITVYFNRLQRKSDFYLSNILGAHYNIISILNNFLQKNNINKSYANLALNGVALAKLKLGKLKVARQIFENSKYKYLYLNINDLSTLSDNIILCRLLLGDINIAFSLSEKNIITSIDCPNKALYCMTLGRHAYLSFIRGDLKNSLKIFEKAEKEFIKTHQQFNYILEQTAYEYNKLLLYLNSYQSVEGRLKEVLNFAKKKKLTGDIGLSYITLAVLKNKIGLDKKKILRLLTKGIENLRLYNDQLFLAEGLIERSKIFLNMNDTFNANEDILESYNIIISSEAKLLLADWYIVSIKLALDEENYIKANTYFKEAKDLSIELDEYFIFKEELKKLESHFDI